MRGRRLLAVAALGAWLACAPHPVREPAPVRPPVASPTVPAAWPFPLDARPAVGQHAMVVTDAPLATTVGVAVLRDDGNAIDAAVATAFALAVVLPSAGNIGGGGFLLAHVDGAAHALDFRETAPAGARRDMFLDERGEPTSGSLTGALASGVQGSVAGLFEAHRRLGTKPWDTLVEPAIRLAEEGFAVDADFATAVAEDSERLALFPESAALYLPGGEPIAVGTRFRNPDLARTLRRIAERGPRGFYEGGTAQATVDEMRRGGGILTLADLAGYRAVWREPIEFAYRDHRVIGMPPPSSGGVTLALIARQLESTDLAALGWRSPAAIHRQAEAFRPAFAVRNSVLGDPDFVEIPLERLLSADYAAELWRTASPERATRSMDLDPPVGGDAEGRHTTHFSVADAHGNVVALTTTLNGSHGSAVTVAGAGFLLNNEMDDFTVKPGAPNLFGLIQGEANAIEPGKRMLSSMTPTIVLDPAGLPVLVTGASGGPKIITTVFLILSGRIDHGLGISAAASAPRFHHQHLPDSIGIERDGLGSAEARALGELGHSIRWLDPRAGSLAATIGRADGSWVGFSDPRTHGLAMGL